MKWAEGINQKQKRVCVNINMQQALVLQQNINIGDKNKKPFFAFMSWGVMAAEGWRKGPWTAEEDRLLVEYVRLHGEGRWNSVAALAGLKRNGKSCRLRWVNYLRPDLKKGQITPYEETVILELHARWGNRWSTIARSLPGRTDNEIKNYWRTHFNKKPKPSSYGTHKAKAPWLLRRQQQQQQQQQLQQEQQNQQQMMLMMNQIMDMKFMSIVVEEDNQITGEEGPWGSMLSTGCAAAAVPEGTSNHIEENLISWDGLWD